MKLFPMLSMLCSVVIFAAPVSAQQYKVVVHEAAGVSSLTSADLNRIFMKQDGKLPGGANAAPVNLPVGEVRDAFSKAVHGRAAAAVAAHWQQQVFSGKAVPPAERSSDAEVIAYVKATPGAIGYVSAGASVPAGVQVVAVR